MCSTWSVLTKKEKRNTVVQYKKIKPNDSTFYFFSVLQQVEINAFSHLSSSHLSSDYIAIIPYPFSLSPSVQSLPYTPLWAIMISILSQMSTRCCRTTWSLSLNPNSLAPSNTSREFWRLRMEVRVSVWVYFCEYLHVCDCGEEWQCSAATDILV